MKIACLQFATRVGQFDANVSTAEALLDEEIDDLHSLDLLVMPELALTGERYKTLVQATAELSQPDPFPGYNFSSLNDIEPFLELQGQGKSSEWARKTAAKYGCIVSIGYPERTEPYRTPSTKDNNYNSVIVIDPKGSVLAHYRKCFLFPTDSTWASGSKAGFCVADGTGILGVKLALAVCMDLNSQGHTAGAHGYEFANHVTSNRAELALLPMSWTWSHLSRADTEGAGCYMPDLFSLKYWIERFDPVVTSDATVTLVLSNRCGVEGSAVYCGSSVVMKVGMGKVDVCGILGLGEERCLIVDTEQDPEYVWENEEVGLEDWSA